MSTTIAINGASHTGDYSQAFLDGVVFELLNTYFDEIDSHIEERIKLSGPHTLPELGHTTLSKHHIGTQSNGAYPGEISNDLNDDMTLLEFASDFMEDDVELSQIRRYLQTAFHYASSSSGRDYSYCMLYSFDDLDFALGFKECTKWLGVKVKLSPILDRTTYTLI